MSNSQLLIRLRDLHEQLLGINIDLNCTERVDDSTIEALGQLVTDANVLVDRAKALSCEVCIDQAVNTDAIKDEHQDLLDRIIGFENSHPRVSKFLTQMTDFLAMIGV